MFSDDRELVDTRSTAPVGIPMVCWAVVNVAGSSSNAASFVEKYFFAFRLVLLCENGEREEGGDDGGEEMHVLE